MTENALDELAAEPIHVLEAGPPRLETASPIPPSDAAAAEPSAAPVAAQWSPGDAAHAICGVFDLVGVPLCGGDLATFEQAWKADPREVQGWDEAAARLLQRFAPQAAGGAGVAGAAADGIIVAEGLSLMAFRRIHRLRQLREGAERRGKAPPRPAPARPQPTGPRAS